MLPGGPFSSTVVFGDSCCFIPGNEKMHKKFTRIRPSYCSVAPPDSTVQYTTAARCSPDIGLFGLRMLGLRINGPSAYRVETVAGF